MRPLRLEMEGFGAYRDATVIDFTDVDLFALSGPTGAGKSTIIDAICVALYGAVPRYDDLRTIAPIISQGMNQATVRLTFSVDGIEHSATRVIVRTKAGGNTKEARLERGDVVLAGNADEVRQAVTDLLGLTFEHFTRCVVLPQGEFAQFLHDKPKERQDLLKRLLGIEIYEQIAAAARARATDARARSTAIEQQLGDLAAATPERRAELDERAAALARLVAQVDTIERDVAAIERQIEALQSERDAVAAHITVLVSVTLPDGVAELESERERADHAQRDAQRELSAAETRLAQQRAELDALGDLGALERARAIHGQLHELAPITADVRAAAAARSTALEALRDELAAMEGGVADATAQVQELERRAAAHEDAIARLEAVRPPAEIDAVTTACRDLDAQLVTAATDDTRLRAQVAEAASRPAPDLDRLATVRAALDRVEQLAERLHGLETRRETAAEKLADAAIARDRASSQLDAARSAREVAELADHAGALRYHLVEGEPCPVCEQTVARVPALTLNADLESARDHVRAAEAEASSAARAFDEADRAASSVQAQIEALQHELDGATGATGGMSRDDLAREQAAADDLQRLITTLRAQLESGAHAIESLRERRQQAGVDLQRVVNQLVQVTATVHDLGPPPADTDDVAGGWHALTRWAATALERQRALLRDAQRISLDERRRCDDLQHSIVARCVEMGVAVAPRQPASAAAHGEAQRVQAELATIDEKLARAASMREQLEDFAASHPLGSAEAADIDQRIGAIRTAQQALDRCDADRRRASDALSSARTALDAIRGRLTVAEQRYASAFAAAAPLGAPSVDETSLAGRWEMLAAWAANELPRRHARAAELDGEVSVARAAIDASTERLQALLAEHAVSTRGGQRASAAVAAAVALHTAAIDEFERQVAKRAELTAAAEACRTEEAVAAQLGRLLDARNFEKWLLDDVLRQLVDGATDRLLDLSGRQYSLAYDKGDFLVVDHRNADQTRSARTLSGGETFLASLALALSLADQLASFSTGKTAMLEALFLDEGFGTLDPDTLDVVAAAIEELGSRGRMIGVVSHVAELAERVPVRYVVTKQGNAATVEKVMQ